MFLIFNWSHFIKQQHRLHLHPYPSIHNSKFCNNWTKNNIFVSLYLFFSPPRTHSIPQTPQDWSHLIKQQHRLHLHLYPSIHNLISCINWKNIIFLSLSLCLFFSPPRTHSTPHTPEDWSHLIKQQHRLHELELSRWKDVLTASVTLVDQVCGVFYFFLSQKWFNIKV